MFHKNSAVSALTGKTAHSNDDIDEGLPCVKSIRLDRRLFIYQNFFLGGARGQKEF